VADRPVKLLEVVRKLDFLDGKLDGVYAGEFPLTTPATSIGACYQAAAQPGCAGKGDVCASTARFQALGGRWIDVDCRKLAGMLDALGEMVVRMPRVRLLVEALSRRKRPSEAPDPRRFTYDDFFAYHVVDHMMLSLLLGVRTSNDALFAVLANVPFQEYDSVIQVYGELLGRSEFQDRSTTTLSGALVLLSALSRKYGFSFKPFTFKKLLKGFKPE
jgi:hypothetical protein